MYVRYKLAGVVVAALGIYGLWLAVLRTMPLFQVQNVTITGLSGNAAPEITATLQRTAREMTTTDFSTARLRQSVVGDNAVAGLRASTQFPHGVRIRVRQRAAVARVAYGGATLAVSADARVLAGVAPSHSLPLIRTDAAPQAGRVTDPVVREELALLAAAPPVLRAHVFAVRTSGEGLTVRLRGGPLIYFGGPLLPHAKWDAAAVVLASGTSHGARYIDVSLPARPAAAVDDPATVAPTGGATLSTAAGSLPGSTSSSTSG